MRIIIAGITYIPQPNGQAVFMGNLAEGLARLGHTVRVIYDSPETHGFLRMRNGVQVQGVPSINLTSFIDNPMAHISVLPQREIKQAMQEVKPDIVHIQDHYPVSQVALWEARRRGIKVIGSNHFMPENVAKFVPWLAFFKPVFMWIAWRWMLGAFRKVDAATAQSVAAARLLQAQGFHVPVTTISCGIDLKRFHPDPNIDRRAYLQKYGLDPDKKIFIFVGRVDLEKRLDVLLHAMQRVQRADVQLAIAGRGQNLDEFKKMSTSLNLGEKAHFTGYIPAEDLPGLLNSADVFVMPSEAELLSIATLEALSCARPVLLADAVALPEWVKPGVNGYLFKPGNPLDAARQIERLAAEAPRWPEMGQASLEIARGHSLEAVVRKFEALYQSVLATQQVSPRRAKISHAVKPQ